MEDSGEIGETGALIRLNETFYVEMSGEMLFKITIENNEWKKSRPIPVQQFEFNFPVNINAGFQTTEENIYFIRNEKYCKRKLKSKQKVLNLRKGLLIYEIPLLFPVPTMGFIEDSLRM